MPDGARPPGDERQATIAQADCARVLYWRAPWCPFAQQKAPEAERPPATDQRHNWKSPGDRQRARAWLGRDHQADSAEFITLLAAGGDAGHIISAGIFNALRVHPKLLTAPGPLHRRASRGIHAEDRRRRCPRLIQDVTHTGKGPCSRHEGPFLRAGRVGQQSDGRPEPW